MCVSALGEEADGVSEHCAEDEGVAVLGAEDVVVDCWLISLGASCWLWDRYVWPGVRLCLSRWCDADVVIDCVRGSRCCRVCCCRRNGEVLEARDDGVLAGAAVASLVTAIYVKYHV